jgi:hypothetical protein
MCGRFRLTRASKLAERFGIEPEDDWVRYSYGFRWEDMGFFAAT